MKFIVQFIFYFLTSIQIAVGQSRVDSIFVDWNKATILSLVKQKYLSIDSVQMGRFENRLAAFKNYLELEDEYCINKKSIRYEFLDEILLMLGNRRQPFFVIEANINSYSVVIQNFLLLADSTNRYRAIKYIYSDGKWHAKNSCIGSLFFDFDSSLNKTEFGKGFNSDDIIVSFFGYNGIVESEYFINFSVSKQSGVREILSICN